MDKKTLSKDFVLFLNSVIESVTKENFDEKFSEISALTNLYKDSLALSILASVVQPGNGYLKCRYKSKILSFLGTVLKLDDQEVFEYFETVEPRDYRAAVLNLAEAREKGFITEDLFVRMLQILRLDASTRPLVDSILKQDTTGRTGPATLVSKFLRSDFSSIPDIASFLSGLQSYEGAVVIPAAPLNWKGLMSLPGAKKFVTQEYVLSPAWKNTKIQHFIVMSIIEKQPTFFVSAKNSFPVPRTFTFPTSFGTSARNARCFWNNRVLLSTLIKFEEKLGISCVKAVLGPYVKTDPKLLLYVLMAHKSMDRPVVAIIEDVLSEMSKSHSEKDGETISYFSHVLPLNYRKFGVAIVPVWEKNKQIILWIVSILQLSKTLLGFLSEHYHPDFTSELLIVSYYQQLLNFEKWIPLQKEIPVIDGIALYIIKLVKTKDKTSVVVASEDRFFAMLSVLYRIDKRSSKKSSALVELFKLLDHTYPKLRNALEVFDQKYIEDEVNMIFESFFSGRWGLLQVKEVLLEKKRNERETFEFFLFHLVKELRNLSSFSREMLVRYGTIVGFLVFEGFLESEPLGTCLRYIRIALSKDYTDKVFSFGEAAIRQVLPKLGQWPKYRKEIIKTLVNNPNDVTSELLMVIDPASRDEMILENIEKVTKTVRQYLDGYSKRTGGDSYRVSFVDKFRDMVKKKITTDMGTLQSASVYLRKVIANASSMHYLLIANLPWQFWIYFSELFANHVESYPMQAQSLSYILGVFYQSKPNVFILLKEKLYERALRYIISDISEVRWLDPRDPQNILNDMSAQNKEKRISSSIINIGRFLSISKIYQEIDAVNLLVYSYIYGRLHITVPFVHAVMGISLFHTNPADVIVELSSIRFLKRPISRNLLSICRANGLMRRGSETILSKYRIFIPADSNKDIDVSLLSEQDVEKYFFHPADSIFNLPVQDYSQYSPDLTRSIKRLFDHGLSDIVVSILPDVIVKSMSTAVYLVGRDFDSSIGWKDYLARYTRSLSGTLFEIRFRERISEFPERVADILRTHGVVGKSAEGLSRFICTEFFDANREEIDSIVSKMISKNIDKLLEQKHVAPRVPDSVLTLMPPYLRPEVPSRSIYILPYNPSMEFYTLTKVQKLFREWFDELRGSLSSLVGQDIDARKKELMERAERLVSLIDRALDVDSAVEYVIHVLVKSLMSLFDDIHQVYSRVRDSELSQADEHAISYGRHVISFLEFFIFKVYESSSGDPDIPVILTRVLLEHAQAKDLDCDLLSDLFTHRMLDIVMMDEYLSDRMMKSLCFFEFTANVLGALRGQNEESVIYRMVNVVSTFSDAIKVHAPSLSPDVVEKLEDLIDGLKETYEISVNGESIVKAFDHFILTCLAQKSKGDSQETRKELEKAIEENLRNYEKYRKTMVSVLLSTAYAYHVDGNSLGVSEYLSRLFVNILVASDKKSRSGVFGNILHVLSDAINADGVVDYLSFYTIASNLFRDFLEVEDDFGEHLDEYYTFLVVTSPQRVPQFTFYWAKLISDPKLLGFLGRDGVNTDGYSDVLVSLLEFEAPFFKRGDVTRRGIKELYLLTLRLFLVLSHDFEDFVLRNSVFFLNHIPKVAVQLRNIILSSWSFEIVLPVANFDKGDPIAYSSGRSEEVVIPGFKVKNLFETRFRQSKVKKKSEIVENLLSLCARPGELCGKAKDFVLYAFKNGTDIDREIILRSVLGKIVIHKPHPWIFVALLVELVKEDADAVLEFISDCYYLRKVIEDVRRNILE